MLVCALLCAHCTRDRGCSAHPVFPAPSHEGGGQEITNSGALRAARSRIHVPCAFNDGDAVNWRRKYCKKKPGHCGRASLLSKSQIANELVRSRSELRNQAFVGLEGLLGEVG